MHLPPVVPCLLASRCCCLSPTHNPPALCCAAPPLLLLLLLLPLPYDARQALKNEPLTMFGDGKQTRSFQYVSDLIEGE